MVEVSAGREGNPARSALLRSFRMIHSASLVPEALPFSKISFPLGDGTRAAPVKKRPLRSLDRCNQGKRPRSRRGSVGSQRTGYPTDARLATRPAIHPQSKQERHEHDRDSHYPYCRAHCALSSSKLGKKGRYREEVRPLEEVQAIKYIANDRGRLALRCHRNSRPAPSVALSPAAIQSL